jgi:hypothetical protein
VIANASQKGRNGWGPAERALAAVHDVTTVRARTPRVSADRVRPAILGRLSLLVGLLLLGFVPQAHAGTLKIIVAGPGSVTLDPPGKHVTTPGGAGTVGPSTCKDGVREGAHDACLFDYDPGTPVTLRASPNAAPPGGPIPSLARWSPLECFGVAECRVIVGEGVTEAAATFNPLSVQVRAFGPGSVTSVPAGINCDPGVADSTCIVELEAGTPVTLTAHSSETVQWTLGCDSSEGPTCSTSASSEPWWVFVHFGPEPVPPEFGPGNRPPRILVRFSVLKGGSGQGSVRGGKVDCGTTCSAEYDEFGQRERLVASPAPGSTFAGWRGACGTAPGCVVPVGIVGSVRAIFDKVPQQSGGSGGTGGTGGSGGSGGTRRPPPAPPRHTNLSVSGVRVSVAGRGQRRTLIVRVVVNRSAAAAVRLVRGRRVLAQRSYRLRRGANRLQLHVPRRVSPGNALVRLRVNSAGGVRTIVRSVRLRR